MDFNKIIAWTGPICKTWTGLICKTWTGFICKTWTLTKLYRLIQLMTILFVGDKRSDFYNMAHEYTFLLFTVFNFRFFNWKKIVF